MAKTQEQLVLEVHSFLQFVDGVKVTAVVPEDIERESKCPPANPEDVRSMVRLQISFLTLLEAMEQVRPILKREKFVLQPTRKSNVFHVRRAN